MLVVAIGIIPSTASLKSLGVEEIMPTSIAYICCWMGWRGIAVDEFARIGLEHSQSKGVVRAGWRCGVKRNQYTENANPIIVREENVGSLLIKTNCRLEQGLGLFPI